MELSGLHLLLTYQCNYECDHCFVWGSPWQSGVMSLENTDHILKEAEDLGTVTQIYYEGGEPFLYYPLLVKGVQMAAKRGFEVGIVSNGYWAREVEDAIEWLRPFAGLIQDLSISCDSYHGDEELDRQEQNARKAAESLGIPIGVIRVALPEATNAAGRIGQLPPGESRVMYRGRAATKLVSRAERQPWEQFTRCPYEDLREPRRVHIDPFGHLHICQGISLGNLFETSLREICERYKPEEHPITGTLLAGGPAALIQRYELPHDEQYADACHLCDHARRALRSQYPDILVPDAMYVS